MDASVPSKAMPAAAVLETYLRQIVGDANVRTADAADAFCGARPRMVVAPANQCELAAVLRLANEENLAVTPRGGGTKLGWGNPPARTDLILSTARLDKITEHVWEDLTVTVEAGCTVGKLQNALALHGQRLALDLLWPDRATIGGILSANDSGALRLRFGSLRDLIIGVTIALADGTLASSGGKVVKNVAGYDLPKLVTGSLGTLGVITKAIFRLHPLPKMARTFSFSVSDMEEAQQTLQALLNSKLACTAIQVQAANDAPPGADILLEGSEAALAAQEANLKKLLERTSITDAPQDVWNARQELWSVSDSATVVKFSVLPAGIANTLEAIRRVAGSEQVTWKAVVQATGIGWLRLEGTPIPVRSALLELRSALEGMGGSLVVLNRPAGIAPIDAWGNAGDALPLMRAVKQQFDPKNTLNPGRFVGGI